MTIMMLRKRVLNKNGFVSLIVPRKSGFFRNSSSSSSSEIRQTFLDFFGNSPVGSHKILPSSSLVPFNDPSLTFVNSGMSQFKSVFLEHSEPPAKKVANAQKCIRVGGKHNDLADVGLDGSHHTFFEMLGNWSFGDYFKWEAISMAWELLTGPYGIDKDKLYVTYFAGNEMMRLPPDLETRDHWRSLGLPDNRILPFDMKDNFWEMAATGPCGPSTEIHYDHSGKGPQFVNQGLGDVVELWNLVFMEYNRVDETVLNNLAQKHVDTGMGFERLLAVKCNTISNYDSDLFIPLFNLISKETGIQEYGKSFKGPDHIDTKYRILADHSRMITACITDGMFPESTPKLKAVLRRALKICQDDFKSDYKLLSKLAEVNSEILGAFYEEMDKNLYKVDILLESESEQLKHLEEDGKSAKTKLVQDYPNAFFVRDIDAKPIFDAVKYIEKHVKKPYEISGDLGLNMKSTFGLSIEQIRMLAEVLNVTFDEAEFEKTMLELKKSSKFDSALSVKDVNKYPRTDNSFVHCYQSPKPLKYIFPVVRGQILNLYDLNDNQLNELKEGSEGIVFLDKSGFYAESGGQAGDIGEIISTDGLNIFQVTDCQKVLNSPDRIAHVGKVKQGHFSKATEVQSRINVQHRLECMQNHTGVHLLNEALHAMLPLTCQKSSHVEPSHFRFDFAAFQFKIDVDFITLLEQQIQETILADEPIVREMRAAEEIYHDPEVIKIPGEIYPATVSTIRMPSGVMEPCCGTHVHRTGDVQALVIIDVKTVGTGIKSFKCLTGSKAAAVRERGLELIGDIAVINQEVEKVTENTEQHDMLKNAKLRIKTERQKIRSTKKDYPYAVVQQMYTILNDLRQHLQTLERSTSKASLQAQFKQVAEEKCQEPFITHFFPWEVDSKITLSKITSLCKNKPVLVLVKSEGNLYGRACVPEKSVKGDFNAEVWLNKVGEKVNGKAKELRYQNKLLVCHLLVEKNTPVEDILEGLRNADEFAKQSI